MALPLVVGGLGVIIGMMIAADETEKKDKEIAKLNLKSVELSEIISSHRGHAEYIVALFALGVAMANADGKITKDEIEYLKEHISGLSANRIPKNISEEMDKRISNPPTFNEAFEIFSRIENLTEKDITDTKILLECIMELDGENHPREIALLKAFEYKVSELYQNRLQYAK